MAVNLDRFQVYCFEVLLNLFVPLHKATSKTAVFDSRVCQRGGVHESSEGGRLEFVLSLRNARLVRYYDVEYDRLTSKALHRNNLAYSAALWTATACGESLVLHQMTLKSTRIIFAQASSNVTHTLELDAWQTERQVLARDASLASPNPSLNEGKFLAPRPPGS